MNLFLLQKQHSPSSLFRTSFHSDRPRLEQAAVPYPEN